MYLFYRFDQVQMSNLVNMTFYLIVYYWDNLLLSRCQHQNNQYEWRIFPFSLRASSPPDATLSSEGVRRGRPVSGEGGRGRPSLTSKLRRSRNRWLPDLSVQLQLPPLWSLTSALSLWLSTQTLKSSGRPLGYYWFCEARMCRFDAGVTLYTFLTTV